MKTITKNDVVDFLAMDVLSELHQIRQKRFMFEKKYNGLYEDVSKLKEGAAENFEIDDDLIEWKAYLQLEKDRLLRLEEIKH